MSESKYVNSLNITDAYFGTNDHTIKDHWEKYDVLPIALSMILLLRA